MRLTILGGSGPSTEILLNWLQSSGYNEIEVIIEAPVPRKTILRSRVRRLGLAAVAGQVAFIALVLPWLRRTSRGRLDEILRTNGLSLATDVRANRIHVANVNSTEVAERLRARAPDVVIVNGTRILRPIVMNAVDSPFINTHVGITPAYRGVHGGYWALWNDDKSNFGVTLHLVDEGVDTGDILAQERTTPTRADNFATYPLLQQAVALPALNKILQMVARGERLMPNPVPESATSRQWYHPTIFQYASGRMRDVK
ncbi:formyl transferase [Thioclava sp. IC9]|uniref:formyl transferase n=1 Tax=Thioclava sp. IC9 TaxID=1973007 RepID=UPI000B53A916|nr:formyl transferase [Thioclava sp. IC9]OWX98810.1 hypothetical protein B6V76_18530 [Thioclava sp. IC9]